MLWIGLRLTNIIFLPYIDMFVNVPPGGRGEGRRGGAFVEERPGLWYKFKEVVKSRITR